MLFAYVDPGSGYTIVSALAYIIAVLVGSLGLFSLFFKRFFNFLKNHKKQTIIILAVLSVIGLAIAGVTMYQKESAFNRKVIILGFDGLSPEIIEPMMKGGVLPNFSRLKESGSYRRLWTTNPSQSPVAWSGFATGRNPGKTGVFDFIVRDPGTYKLNLSLSHFERGKYKPVIQGKCFWDYTSAARIPTVIITCPVTFPPSRIHGRMLSGMGVPDILGTEGTFTFYTSESLSKDKDIGGNVFKVQKSPLMILNLIGPRRSSVGGAAEQVKVPLKVTHEKGSEKISIEYQNDTFDLRVGRWSDWKEVTFKVGMLKKMKGIVKFYLVETEPEFKLYISPINFDPRSPYFPLSYPGKYSKELAAEIGLFHTRGMPMDTWAVNEGRLSEEPFLEQVEEVLREKKAMLEYELNRFERGVLFCYFESPDIIQHMFWRYTDPRHPLHEKDAPQKYKEVIERWYREMDAVLGNVMRRIGSADTLIVLSDHGFDTFRRSVHLNSWLRRNGYLELKSASGESGMELLRDVDWSRTKAYAIGFGAIYINQKGREGRGIVPPGKETESLKEEITEKLKQWSDEKYGMPIINNVYRREEIFWGDYMDETPDLYVGFNIGYRASWQTALGACPKELIEDNLKKWSGSHLFDPDLIPGIIFSNRTITKKQPSIYDVTPTILQMAGFDEEKRKGFDLDGTPLFQ